LTDGKICESAVTPGQLRSWDGVVLAGRPMDHLLADLHRRHLPTVMASNTHERIRTSAVLPDYAQGAFELTQYLVRLGHVKVRLMLAQDLLPAARVAEAGYRAALQRNGLEPLEVCEVDAAFDWSGLLSGDAKPSALLCVGADVGFMAQATAQAANCSVPGSLSLCTIPEPGRAEQVKGTTAYELRCEDLAHWLVELLVGAAPGQSPRTIIVPGRLVDRGTCAAPLSPSSSCPTPTHVEI
jgi:DNA-binding LacI/PurR family transcriptional regulator